MSDLCHASETRSWNYDGLRNESGTIKAIKISARADAGPRSPSAHA
jgi:hypothetical protein